MMENMTRPVAVPGLREAGKIRAVIYANNQLAHVPLAEILKLTVQTGYKAAQSSNGQAGGEKPKAALAEPAHFIRLNETLLIQYGFQAVDKSSNGTNDRLNIRFPLSFANADYYPFFSLYAGPNESAAAAFIMAESLEKTGFAVQRAAVPHLMAADKASQAQPGGRPGFFWLAIGYAAQAGLKGESDDGSLSFP
ncbi:MAG: hypothetical protein DU429_05190 [Candidatus Tokpelaia sp.]|nr:MAG: hypothetical protein DU430_07860 [Candidatus Tokpelaia sp.]KAA6206857.1 MAG: hypothetical protein DU429_05190 [Candidatus Tokpelaia sp.]